MDCTVSGVPGLLRSMLMTDFTSPFMVMMDLASPFMPLPLWRLSRIQMLVALATAHRDQLKQDQPGISERSIRLIRMIAAACAQRGR